MKNQNPRIKKLMDSGSEFSVVFTKEHKVKGSRFYNDDESSDNIEHQVVARVSDDIRDAIQCSKDKIYLGFNSHHVVDRFYIKSCSSCHKFGHYHADCDAEQSCGYCCSTDHQSNECLIHKAKDFKLYKCINCKESGKNDAGHSSHWPKCPTYVELQNKMKKNIPYYSKN